MEGLTLEEMQAKLASLTAEKEALASEKAGFVGQLAEAEAKAAVLASEKAEAQAKASALAAEKDAAKADAEKLKNDYITVASEREKALDLFYKADKERHELAERVAAVDAEARAKAPVEFETEDGSKYEFTCPTFTWDDGIVYNVRKLEEEAAKDAKAAEKYASICAQLIVRESGIIRKK